MAYVRTVKTASGATAVQIVYSIRRGARRIEHIGSGHDEAEVEALKAAARHRLAQGQAVLDLDLDADGAAAGPARIVSSRAGHLWDSLARAYDALGFEVATEAEVVFRHLVLARIIEPTQQFRLPARARGGQRSRGVLRDGEAAPAHLRRDVLAGGAGQGLRCARGARSGVAGPLRRVDPVLRDPPRSCQVRSDLLPRPEGTCCPGVPPSRCSR